MQKAILLLAGFLVTAAPAQAQDKQPDDSCDGGTSDIVACLNEKTAAWDKKLNDAYREALKDARPEQAEKLRAAQRLWIQYRDANCEYYAYGEGSIARIDAAECLRSMTEARAKELSEGLGN